MELRSECTTLIVDTCTWGNVWLHQDVGAIDYSAHGYLINEELWLFEKINYGYLEACDTISDRYCKLVILKGIWMI